jgi:hypothetical protein
MSFADDAKVSARNRYRRPDMVLVFGGVGLALHAVLLRFVGKGSKIARVILLLGILPAILFSAFVAQSSPMRAAGMKVSQIARQLGLCRRRIDKWIWLDELPERKPGAANLSVLIMGTRVFMTCYGLGR